MRPANFRFQNLVALVVIFLFALEHQSALAESSASQGLKLLKQGNVDAAIEQFEASLQRNPNDLDSLLGMATVLKNTKRADRAERYLRRAHELSPQNKQALAMLIEVLSWDKRTHKESMSLLINFIKSHPNDIKARRDLVRLASADKSTFDIAVEQLKFIVDREPDDVESMLHLARLRNWTPHWKDAEKYFRLYLERRPDDLAVREEYADLLAFQKKDSSTAASEYKIILKTKPKNLDARIKLINALEAWRRYKEAFDEYKQLQSIKPDMKIKRFDSRGKEIFVPISLAMAQFTNWQLKDYPLSRQLYSAYLNQNRDDVKARLEYFELLMHRFSDRAHAIEQIDIVLKQQPDNEDALLSKCRTFMYAQQYGLAESAIRQLLRRHPQAKIDVFVDNKWQLKPAAVALATMIHLQGKREDAEHILTSYMNSHPSDLTIGRLLKTWQSITAGGAEMDPAELDRYLVAHPDDNAKRIEKISYLLGENKLEDALEQMRILQSKKADVSVELYIHGESRKVNLPVAIAQTLFRLKKVDEGKAVFDAYLSEHPEDSVARYECAHLLSYHGKSEKQTSLEHFDHLSMHGDETKIESVRDKANLHKAILFAELGKFDEANKTVDQLVLQNPQLPALEQGEKRFMTPALAKAFILLLGGQPAQSEGVIRHYYPDYSQIENELVLNFLAQAVGRQKGRESEAFSLLDSILSKRSDPLLLQVKADLLASVGKTDNAIDLYKKLISDSKNVDHWLVVRLSEILLGAGRVEESKEVLKKYGDLNEYGKQHLIADALVDLGEFDSGIRIYERLLSGEKELEDADKSSISLALAYAYARTGQKEKSEALADAAVDAAPQAVLERRLGQFFNHKNSREVIAKALYKLIKNEPDNSFYLRQLAELELWHLDQRDKGLATMARYLTMRPDDLDAKLQLANAYNYANQSKRSLRLFQELIEAKPNDPDIILGLASAQMNVPSEVKKSLENFRRYFALRPDDMNAKVLMAFAMCHAGSRADAIRMLYDMRKQHPDDPQLLLVLARTETDSTTHKDSGIEHLREYLTLKPADKNARRALAEALSWGGGAKRKEALSIYEDLAQASPSDIELRISRAMLLNRSGKGRVAFNNLRQILEEQPENKRALLAMADYHASNQDFFKAETYLKKARGLYPEDPIVALDSARNFRSIGRYDKALAELRKMRILQSRVENM